ncbi:MAG TPA: permease [Thermoanaerobaculia bacterium]|nr:permease [Thermoanaerobaculia bacterium]
MKALALRYPGDRSPWSGLVLAVFGWLGLYRLLRPFWDWFVFEVLGMPPSARFAQGIHFFFYDTTKILLLLTGIVFAIAVLRSFFSLERTRALLGGRREGLGNLAGAAFGVVTPFCSCSAVPAFIGFVAAGVPLGVTLSFLIASPMVNEVAIVLLYGLFGWKVALLYVTSGLVLAISAGFVLGRLRLEKWVEPFVYEMSVGGAAFDPSAGLTWEQRFAIGRAEVRSILGRIWPYLLVGIGLGALIHGWVPESFFLRWAGPDRPFAVPVAVALGIPLYSNAAGILPLIEALHAKGVAMGTLLAFMMAVVALSLPEMILLRRVLKPQLIALWAAVVGFGIMLTGFLFNAIL